MNKVKLVALSVTALGIFLLAASPESWAQPGKGEGKKDPGAPGFGPGGKGGFGGPFGQTRKIVKDFDKNGDGWLNSDERAVARESLKNQGGFRPGGKMGFGKGGNLAPAQPGPKMSPTDVPPIAKASLYE